MEEMIFSRLADVSSESAAATAAPCFPERKVFEGWRCFHQPSRCSLMEGSARAGHGGFGQKT